MSEKPQAPEPLSLAEIWEQLSQAPGYKYDPWRRQDRGLEFQERNSS